MALTDSQVQARIEALEAKVNEIQIAINNLASKKTLNALLLVRQKEIDELKQQVKTLETEIAALQALHV